LPPLHDVEFHLVSDGTVWVDGGGAFGLVPRSVWENIYPHDDGNLVPLAQTCLLIRSEGKTILVDTGQGEKAREKAGDAPDPRIHAGLLLESLSRLGVGAEDIDIVINTHLHADHCSGNTVLRDGQRVPAFPNARYVIQRIEWADAMYPNERTRATYRRENYQPLQEAGCLEIISGDTHITSQVSTAVTRGHSRGHQVVVIESGGEWAVFVGDMTTIRHQFERLAWVSGYDAEPLESVETKRYWQQWALEKDALILFQHDAEMSMAKLRRDGKRFRLEPVSPKFNQKPTETRADR
jgi:glyoxylase-like metal-dependent hydrolase (beta-lactamase superfamily II)